MGDAHDLFALVGTTIAEKYRIDRVLREGGFRVVYEGPHLFLGARLAVKCFKPLRAPAPDQRRTTDLFLRGAGVRSAQVVGVGGPGWVGDQATSARGGAFTPRYAAPEEWDASLGALGPATGVFALGLLIAESCTLEPLLAGSTPTQILASVM